MPLYGVRRDVRFSKSTDAIAKAALSAAQSAAVAVAAIPAVIDRMAQTEVTSAVSYVEHTFSADTYEAVWVEFSDLSGTAAANLVATLRNASAAIVTLTAVNPDGVSMFATAASDIASGRADFILGMSGAKRSAGRMFASCSSGATFPSSIGFGVAGGSNATSADRVRVAWSTGNVDAGIVTSFGIRKA